MTIPEIPKAEYAERAERVRRLMRLHATDAVLVYHDELHMANERLPGRARVWSLSDHGHRAHRRAERIRVALLGAEQR